MRRFIVAGHAHRGAHHRRLLRFSGPRRRHPTYGNPRSLLMKRIIATIALLILPSSALAGSLTAAAAMIMNTDLGHGEFTIVRIFNPNAQAVDVRAALFYDNG